MAVQDAGTHSRRTKDNKVCGFLALPDRGSLGLKPLISISAFCRPFPAPVEARGSACFLKSVISKEKIRGHLTGDETRESGLSKQFTRHPFTLSAKTDLSKP